MNSLISERLFPVEAWAANAGGGDDGAWVPVGQYKRVGAIVAMSGTGAGDVVLTVQQATDSSGTGAKDLNVRNFTLYDEDGAAVGVMTEQDSATCTLTGTQNTAHIAIVEIRADDLDINNSFNHIRVRSAANAGKTMGAYYAMADGMQGPAYSYIPS